MRKAPYILALSLVGAFLIAQPVFADSLDLVSPASLGALQDLGRSSSKEALFQYTPGASHNLCSATLLLRKNGSPVDSLMLSVYLGNALGSAGFATSTSYSLLRDADSQWQITTNSLDPYIFTFTPCLAVAGGYQYGIRVRRSGVVDNTNYYSLGGQASPATLSPAYVGTGSYAFRYISSSAWPTIDGTSGWVETTGLLANSSAWYISLNGTENYGLTSASTTQSFSQGVIDTILGINESNASSTTVGGFAAFWSLQGLLQTKFPFNYLFEIGTDFSLFSVGTTTTTWTFTLPLSLGTDSSSTLGVLPSSWPIISSSTLAVYYPDATRLFFRNLVGVFLTVGWGFLMFNRVRFLFK